MYSLLIYFVKKIWKSKKKNFIRDMNFHYHHYVFLVFLVLWKLIFIPFSQLLSSSSSNNRKMMMIMMKHLIILTTTTTAKKKVLKMDNLGNLIYIYDEFFSVFRFEWIFNEVEFFFKIRFILSALFDDDDDDGDGKR